MTVMIMMGIYGTNKCHIHVTLIRFMKDDDDYDNDQQIIDLHQKYNCDTWRLSHHVYVVRCQLLVSHLYLLPSDHNKGEWDLYHTPPLKCRKTPVGILETRAYGAAVPKSKRNPTCFLGVAREPNVDTRPLPYAATTIESHRYKTRSPDADRLSSTEFIAT